MSDSSEDGPDVDSVLDWFERYYHVLVIAGIGAFMLWIRSRTWERFFREGQVFLTGNDAWYHLRQIVYTVEHYPETMPYEVWTNFPTGTAPGQFGTFFDQLLATVALILGLGDPSRELIATILLFSPVVFGVLTLIPTYYIARHVADRRAGVLAVLVVGLTTSPFFGRSLVGAGDHHVVEAFFQAVAVLGVVVALMVARRDKPVVEQFTTRDVAGLRRTVGWSALAGLGVSMYMWVWPFGVVLVGILGVFFLLQLLIEFTRGESPEHTAIVGAVAMGTTAVTMLPALDFLSPSPSNFTLLQPLLAAAVAGGCVFLAVLARRWERRDLPRAYYPVSVIALLVAGFAFIAVAIPDLFSMIVNNVSSRIFGFITGISGTSVTVGEITSLLAPGRDPIGILFGWFGLTIYIAAFAVLLIVGKVLLGREHRAEHFLLVVWAFFALAMTLTQDRFGYYLPVPVAVLTGLGLKWFLDFVNFDIDVRRPQFYQVMSVVVILLVVMAPLVLVSSPLVADRNNGPSQGSLGWEDSLDWMQENTPVEGEFDGADNAMDYLETHSYTEDYDYPDGAYGVLSWWDYGHWITVMGERIPNANPFQQGTQTAADFLLSPTEEQANELLDGVDEEDAETRYVMVDWQMVEPTTSVRAGPLTRNQAEGTTGKFFAPPNFYSRGDVSLQDYTRQLFGVMGSGQQRQVYTFNYVTQDYHETMVNRLYHYHGSAVDPSPIVLDWGTVDLGDGQPGTEPLQSNPVRFFPSMEEARNYTSNDPTSRVGGLGPYPNERVSALEHYRLVGTSEMSATESQRYGLVTFAEAFSTRPDLVSRVSNASECSTDMTLGLTNGEHLCLSQGGYDLLHRTAPQWTKVFERVDGAELTGSVSENATVSAAVEMYNPASNETFVYRQRTTAGEDGEFSMTVPYSTTGYDDFGPDNGHTNVSVRATGDYSIAVDDGTTDNPVDQTGTVAVPEAAVVGESEEPIPVDLTDVGGDSAGNAGTSSANATAGTTPPSAGDSSAPNGSTLPAPSS